MAVVVGLRVLRGPDWSGNDEDGGEGYLGTVVKLLGNQEVQVLWDIGQESTCSAGLDGKFELRIFDSAQVGIRHKESCCANCGESGIFGMLWRCQECSSSDLCSLCYSKDAHDLRHAYLRIDKPGASGQPVPKRKLSVKCRAIGIFPGSKVIRGKDWQWGDQDGGQGTEGVVKDYENVSPDCSRNLMLVVWPNGESNSYRLGFCGSVDLKCVEEELGPYYYRDHLPLLDLKALEQHADQQDDSHISAASKSSPCPDATSSEENAPDAGLSDTEELSVVVGDRVAVKVEAEKLRELQKDYGGCTDGMIRCIGLTGEVTKLSRGAAFVHFSTSKVSYRFNVKALIKVLVGWNAGDAVRIRANNELLRILNRRLGWNTFMDSTLNKVGRIVTVNEAGDLEVDIGGHRHHFSPACCLPASTAATEEKSCSSACAAVVKGTNSGGLDTVIQLPVSIAPGGAAKEENNNMALFQKAREMVLTDRSRFQHQNIGIVGKMLFAAVEQDDTAEIRNLCHQCPALTENNYPYRSLHHYLYIIPKENSTHSNKFYLCSEQEDFQGYPWIQPPDATTVITVEAEGYGGKCDTGLSAISENLETVQLRKKSEEDKFSEANLLIVKTAQLDKKMKKDCDASMVNAEISQLVMTNEIDYDSSIVNMGTVQPSMLQGIVFSASMVNIETAKPGVIHGMDIYANIVNIGTAQLFRLKRLMSLYIARYGTAFQPYFGEGIGDVDTTQFITQLKKGSEASLMDVLSLEIGMRLSAISEARSGTVQDSGANFARMETPQFSKKVKTDSSPSLVNADKHQTVPAKLTSVLFNIPKIDERGREGHEDEPKHVEFEEKVKIVPIASQTVTNGQKKKKKQKVNKSVDKEISNNAAITESPTDLRTPIQEKERILLKRRCARKTYCHDETLPVISQASYKKQKKKVQASKHRLVRKSVDLEVSNNAGLAAVPNDIKTPPEQKDVCSKWYRLSPFW